MKLIYKVSVVSVKPSKAKPVKWRINANGLAASSGWTTPQLIGRACVQPPADGLMEFDFVAQPPTGISLPVLTPIAAQLDVAVPPWARGVKVIAATNRVVATPAFSAMKATMESQLFIAHEEARAVDLALEMRLDADVSFYDTLVTMEGQSIDGWAWDSDKSAYVCACPGFPVNGALEVFASARSRNQADVAKALVLTVFAPEGVKHVLTVATKNFKGRAAASYHV